MLDNISPSSNDSLINMNFDEKLSTSHLSSMYMGPSLVNSNAASSSKSPKKVTCLKWFGKVLFKHKRMYTCT